MRYYLCCPKCGCKDLDKNENNHYICERCDEVNYHDDLDCREE